MKVIKPNAVKIRKSNVPADTTQTWTSSKAYAENDTVQYQNRLYKSLKGSNSGNQPQPDTGTGTPDSWWRDMGATNQWRMFDETIGTQTALTGEGPLEMVLELDFVRASGFALLNITGHNVRAEVFDGDDATPYWSRTYDLIKPRQGWWNWFFGEIAYIRDVVATDIPAVRFGRLRLTISGVNAVAVGHFTHGMQTEVGATLYGVSASMRSYSKKETNEYGNTRLIKRRNAKRFNGELVFSPTEADAVYSLLTDLDSVLALWIGDNRDSSKGGHQALTVFGWAEDFNELFKGPNQTELSITIQGLT